MAQVTADRHNLRFVVTDQGVFPTRVGVGRHLHPGWEGADLGNPGSAYKDLGETLRAKECLAEAARILAEIEDPRIENHCIVSAAS